MSTISSPKASSSKASNVTLAGGQSKLRNYLRSVLLSPIALLLFYNITKKNLTKRKYLTSSRNDQQQHY